MAIVGYGRTSTLEQQAGLADQVAELNNHGVTKLFTEQLSGVDADRPQLKAALDYCREGDTFVVTKPDRLARSTLDLLTIAKGLADRGVTVRILSMGIDTSTPTGKLMLTMLAGVAEFERDLMLERQRAGIAAAKAEGRYKGRAPTARKQAADILAAKAEGKTPAEIMAAFKVSKASYYRIVSEAA